MNDSPENLLTPKELTRRLAWFNQYVARFESQPTGLPLRCPCCGCKTLDERGEWDICPVCFWEDEGQDDHNADEVYGGANGPLSLSEARTNYLRMGACQESMVRNVRPPRPEELPDESKTSQGREPER